MRTELSLLALLFFMFTVAMTAPAQADVPYGTVFSGTLESISGAPESGSYDMQFELFVGGSPVWCVEYENIPVGLDGSFSVSLGSSGGTAMTAAGSTTSPACDTGGGSVPIDPSLFALDTSTTAVDLALIVYDSTTSTWEPINTLFPISSSLFALQANTAVSALGIGGVGGTSVPISPTAPTDQQVLQYTAATEQWVPATLQNVNTSGSSSTTVGNSTGGVALNGTVTQSGGSFSQSGGSITQTGNSSATIGTGNGAVQIGTGTGGTTIGGGGGSVTIGDSGAGTTTLQGTTDETGTVNINTSGSASTTIGGSSGTTTIGGPLTLSSTSANSVLFANSSNQVTTDNSKLSWLDSSGRLGIGTTTPAASLDVEGGNINLASTTSSVVGVITQNGSPLIQTYGSDNFFAGAGAGNFSLTTEDASDDTGIGGGALASVTTGGFNTGVGYQALTSDTTGSGLTAVGFEALQSATNGPNTAFGDSALGQATSAAAINNDAFGYLALYSVTTGRQNTAIGDLAGEGLISGNENTFVGQAAVPASSSDSEMVVVGAGASAGSESIAIGYGASTTNANTAVIGNPSYITTTLLSGNVGIGTTAPQATLDVNGHIGNSAAPTLSVSGCTLEYGNDTRGQVLIAAETVCTITFANSYVSTPTCVVGGVDSGSNSSYVKSSGTSAGALAIDNAALSPATINYICMQ